MESILHNAPGEYLQHSDVLGGVRDYPRMALSVAGETPFLFGELLAAAARRDPEHPLKGIEDWAVMSCEGLERLVEVTVQNDRGLRETVPEYIEDSFNLKLSGPMAQAFRHAELNESKSYSPFFGFY